EAQAAPRRASRKSVAFTEEKLVVDSDGSVTIMASTNDEPAESTAVSHTPGTPELHATLSAFTDASQALDAADAADSDSLDLSLLKKKKKKAVKVDDGENAGEDAGGEEAGLDLTLKKKKKKKPVGDDFAKKLEALNLEEGKDEDKEAEKADDETQSGSFEEGTGVWSHDEALPIKYDLLLGRFFAQLAQKNPDHASSASKSYKIPPPQCLREGNKKTVFANIVEICKRMKRTEDHVTQFLFAELGTTGSVDGSRRLVIKGKFQAKQIENVLRKYIIEYVTCRTCRSPDTELSKGENRLNFITCNHCGSRRSVTAIKTGFSAQVGKRRKMQG
ncbi:hypothetical protein GQ53DRAFT_670785, partial [Thozetella sp. PMI_491]